MGPGHRRGERREGERSRGGIEVTLAIALIGVVVTVGGCDPPADTVDEVIRRDSLGVEIVSSAGFDRPLEAVFEVEFELGGRESGPESFFRVSRYVVGTDDLGRIHVLDTDNFRVVSFDSDGRHLHSAGGPGEGPGEMGFPSGLAVSPEGEAVVADLSKTFLPRYVDGAEMEPFPLPFQGGISQIRWADGGLAVQLFQLDPDGIVRSLYLADPEGDTTAVHRYYGDEANPVRFESCGIGIAALGPIFEPTIPWDAGPGGLLFVPGAEYEIRLVRSGRLTHVLRRRLEPRRADRATALAHLGEGMRIGIGGGRSVVCDPEEVLEQRGFAPVLPWVSSLVVAPDQTIWVRRFAAPEGEVGPIDLFDASGAYLGTLPPETALPISFLPDGRALLADEDEVTEIQRILVGHLEVRDAEGG